MNAPSNFTRALARAATATLSILMLTGLVATGCADASPGGTVENGAANGAWLRKQMQKAKSGSVIEVPAGHYDLSDVEIGKSLTLRGPGDDGAVVFYSATVLSKGILVPLSGVSLTVENVTFKDARAWDKNGAGIRHEGRDLTIVNCAFEGNEDGILATSDPKGVITISGSEFIENGYGDGQSHAIYVNEAAALRVTDSRFIGTRIGHHVKSLAEETTVEGSYFDDAYGRSSYAVDVSRGGALRVSGNTMIQSADSDNYHFVNFDTRRGGKAVSIEITGNEIVNKYDGGVFLRNDSKVTPVIEGNTVTNEGAKPLKMIRG